MTESTDAKDTTARTSPLIDMLTHTPPKAISFKQAFFHPVKVLALSRLLAEKTQDWQCPHKPGSFLGFVSWFIICGFLFWLNFVSFADYFAPYLHAFPVSLLAIACAFLFAYVCFMQRERESVNQTTQHEVHRQRHVEIFGEDFDSFCH